LLAIGLWLLARVVSTSDWVLIAFMTLFLLIGCSGHIASILRSPRRPTPYSDANRTAPISSSVSSIGLVFMLLPRESATRAGIDAAVTP
jgi:hypothetical protein